MSKRKMLINTDHPEECRAVITEDGNLEDYIVEHSMQELIKGNVYRGIITRVEPAIEAAFVDYGGKKYGFLPFKDVHPSSYIETGERKAKVRIQDVLFSGQKIIVQVVKEERDAKGPTLSNYISIPGRFLVLMSGSDSTGVSRKIEDEEERKKLKEILSFLDLPGDMGVIIRTAGLGRTKLDLQKDLQMLKKIWETIEKEANRSDSKPIMLYRGPDMVVRTVRDHFTADTQEILVDNHDAYKKIKEFFKLVMPRMQKCVKFYQNSKPLFSQYNIEGQIESIYNRRVELPAGGSLIFDIGEAMVSIDVNSGKTTSASELEETALRTNLEAADEVARQLRLRDLGGLVVIDFIDMLQKKNKSLIEKQLKQACKKDKARVNISRISRFGLIEMSRQRMSPPVKEAAFDRCHFCEGSGQVKSIVSIVLNVLRSIQELLAQGHVAVLEAVISNQAVNYLLNMKSRFIWELEQKHNVKIQFVGKENLSYSDFSYYVLEKRKEEEKIIEKVKDKEEEKEKRSKTNGSASVKTNGSDSVIEEGVEKVSDEEEEKPKKTSSRGGRSKSGTAKRVSRRTGNKRAPQGKTKKWKSRTGSKTSAEDKDSTKPGTENIGSEAGNSFGPQQPESHAEPGKTSLPEASPIEPTGLASPVEPKIPGMSPPEDWLP